MFSKYFLTKKSHLQRRKTCSNRCDGDRKSVIYKGEDNPNYGNRGESNPMYKGGYISKYGYKLIRKPDHPNARQGGYVFEHRYVMSKHIGRPLREDEIIHHKDEDRLNNEITNLEIMTRSEHSKLHMEDYEIIRCDLGRIKTSKRIQSLPTVEAIEIDSIGDTERGTGGFGSSGI